ncbi:MAG: CocE/NonD family hydrolase [Ilumatobacteraceae bacterium]
MTHIRTDFPYAVERIDDIWITVPDGTRLSATIRRPASGLPAPAILEYLPYRKDDGTLVRDQRQHDYLAGMGFACVRVDARGTGDSEGILEGEYLEEELADGEFLVDWIRDQDWCNGRVAIMGISWGGFNGLQIAARPTSRVDAVVSVASTVDRYATDVHYKGGCVLGTDMLPWSATMLCFDARPPTPSVVGDGWREQWIDRLERSPVFIHDWLAHQRRDDFWRHGSICDDFSALDCPVLIVGGLADGYTDTVARLMEGVGPRDGDVRGIVGPWSHNYPLVGIPGPNIGFLQEIVDFLGEHLALDPRPAPPQRASWEDPLRVWVQESITPDPARTEHPGRWVSESAWPSPGIVERRLALGDGVLGSSGEPGVVIEGSNEVTVGVRQGSWWGYAQPGQLPSDQRLEEPPAFSFVGDATSATTVVGFPRVELRLAVDRPVAQVAARLSDVAPDGTTLQISRGLLNLCHRDSDAEPTPVPVGELIDVAFELDFTAHDLPAGHRLRLDLSTSLWPLAWPTPEDVRLTVEVGGQSALVLPVRNDPAGLAEPVFEPAEASEVTARVTGGARQERTMTEDLGSGRVAIIDDSATGDLLLDELGTTMTSTALDRWEIVRGDPLSARVTCERTWSIDWAGHRAEVRTTSEMWCDATHFHTRDRLVALENDSEIFSSDRNSSHRRDLR